MNNLEHQIELLRDQMEKEYSKTPTDEKKILKLSQKLDKLLNQYQKSIKK